MNVSTNVAYRIYAVQQCKKAIAFNTQTEQYMFLDGLSAELLELILKDAESELQGWLEENQISNDDVVAFKETMESFGFWSEVMRCHAVMSADSNSKPDQNQYALNVFQNFLHENAMYYMFHLDLTNRCNERCVHCYHPFECYDYSSELTLDEVKSLIDTVYDLGVFLITLSGGECLLRKDFFEILSYISEKGMMVNIFTNGLLLTEENVQKLKNYRVKLVSISLYGDTAEVHDRITTIPGSYQRTMDGINLLKAHQIPFELKCVVLAENIARVEHTRILADQLTNGRDCRIDFSLCGKIDGDCTNFSHRASKEDIRKVFYANPDRYFSPKDFIPKNPDDTPCGAGKYGLYCSADGNIYPCVSFRLHLCTWRELADISTNPVLTAWRRTKIADFTDCFKHDYCNYCTEQCAGNNLIENGDHLDSKGICNCERAMIISEWFQNHSVN